MNIEETKIKPDGYAEQSPKYLKNIIAKMRELPEHDRAVWIEGIFKEFGIENDISYYLGHNQGVLQAKDSLKPEIPQCVADFYKEKKHAFMYFYVRLIVDFYQNRTTKYNQSFIDWVRKTNDAYAILINMHQFGYTVKKEKLYTVEIPNPNDKQIALRLEKWVEGKVRIVTTHSSNNFTDDMRLTEREIRKDFEWAWREGFSEEVTDL